MPGHATRRSPEYDTLIRETLAQQQLVKRESLPVRLPPRRFPWAQALTETWVKWLEGSGVHVVGDPDDLWPVPLPEGEPFLNPDKVKARRQLDAALDALVAMTTEAATRPEPDRQLVNRVRARARLLLERDPHA